LEFSQNKNIQNYYLIMIKKGTVWVLFTNQIFYNKKTLQNELVIILKGSNIFLFSP